MILAANRRPGGIRTLLLLIWITAWSPALLRADPPAVAGATPAAEAPAIRELEYKLDPPGVQLPYALFVPSNYDKTKPTPLVVLLHGLGGDPRGILRYEGITDEAERRGFLVVAPEGYNSHGWYGSLGPGKIDDRFRGRAAGEDPENLGELSEQDVLHVLDLVRHDYKVDPERVYLMGHSMGGGGTFYLALKHPSLWAAIAPMSPAIYSDPQQLSAIRTLPAIVVQGDADRLVKVETTRRWVESMKTLGMPHKYIEIPGGDHVRVIARNPEMIHQVFEFLAAHKRSAAAGKKS